MGKAGFKIIFFSIQVENSKMGKTGFKTIFSKSRNFIENRVTFWVEIRNPKTGGGKQSDPGNLEGQDNNCWHTNLKTVYGSGYNQLSSRARNMC